MSGPSRASPVHIVFLADGEEILEAKVDPEQTAMQRFALPEPVKARKLTFQLRHSNPGDTTWTKLQQIAAFTPAGTNVIEHPISSIIRDEERPVQEEPHWYDGMFIGVHGGNNHVYFARVERYDPETRRLFTPHFQANGCSDILFEGNYVHNTVAVNRNAERLVFRNNVIDGLGRAALAVGMGTSGRVGGREIKDIHFVNNTFVNTDPGTAWATGILGQRRGSPSAPQGLIIRNNILCGLAEDISGEIENNIYTRPVEQRFMGPGCQVVADPDVLFRDPARGDYRRQPGGPAMDVGASIPPPARRAAA